MRGWRTFAAGLAADRAPEPAWAPLPWWATWRCWLALAALSLLPFLIARHPPLGDLFSHIGRYHVMLDGGRSELLARYYRYEWGLTANLGQDLLMLPVGSLLGAERGAFLLMALLPPALILGLRQLSQAAHGRVQPTALLALPFAYAFPFLFGFANYWMAVTIAIWVIALWFRIRERGVAMRSALLAILALLTWLSHMAGWAALVVGVGSIELAAAWRGAPRPSLTRLFVGGLRATPVLAPIAAMLVVRSGASELAWQTAYFHLKFYFLAFTLRDQSMWLDLASQALIGLGVLILLLRRWARVDPGLLLAAGVLFALFWILPTDFMNGFYADLRLLPVVAILALVSLRSGSGERRASMLAALAIALFAVRLGVTTIGWASASADIAQDLRALDGVERGARIAVLAPIRTCDNWPNDSVSHFPSLAIVRREAFVNTEWDIPGQQLMQPVYNRDHGYNSMLSSNLRLPDASCGGHSVEEWLAGLPRGRFDYVWLFRTPAFGNGDYPWLEERYRGPKGTLYRIAAR